MSEWKAKRFWKAAAVEQVEDGYTVRLDGRPVKTPSKTALTVPTRALAEKIATEWDAQEDVIDPFTMPFTRSSNAAIDKVRVQKPEVADLIAAYGDADLTCYRADSPAALVALQERAWNPLLDWAEERFGARLQPVAGVMHQPQDARALGILSDKVHAMDAFALTAFHDLVGMSGSLIIGFAALEDLHEPHHLWALSRIDETWQEEQWGLDEEAQEVAAKKESDFLHAKRFYDVSRLI